MVVPADTYRVAVVPAATDDPPVLGPVDLPVPAGKAMRVFAIGVAERGTMDASSTPCPCRSPVRTEAPGGVPGGTGGQHDVTAAGPTALAWGGAPAISRGRAAGCAGGRRRAAGPRVSDRRRPAVGGRGPPSSGSACSSAGVRGHRPGAAAAAPVDPRPRGGDGTDPRALGPQPPATRRRVTPRPTATARAGAVGAPAAAVARVRAHPAVLRPGGGRGVRAGGPGGRGRRHPDAPRRRRPVGWWRGGSRAGTPFGTAVVAGHLDSATDPAGYLAGLSVLVPGDLVELRLGQEQRATGSSQLPAPERRPVPRSDLFEQRRRHRLLLITCGGPYDEEPAATATTASSRRCRYPG